MVCATVKMLFLTRFAARFSSLCQENVRTGTAATLAAYRAIRVKMRPTCRALEQAGQDAVDQLAKPTEDIAVRDHPKKSRLRRKGGGDMKSGSHALRRSRVAEFQMLLAQASRNHAGGFQRVSSVVSATPT